MNRYSRNETMLTHQENKSLRKKKILVAGCGGLGGYIAEMLARLGVGHLTLVDGDVFEESNLNRQLFSDSRRIGQSKAEAGRERLNLVNPDVTVTIFYETLNKENARDICAGHHVLMDGLDSAGSRRILQEAGEILSIPMVHGAIAGWYGQVTTIFPGDRALEKIYPPDAERGIEQDMGNPSFTPALVASVQAAEALKILIGRGTLLRGRLLYMDCLSHEYNTFEI